MSGTDADFVVKLIDVYPDNIEYETNKKDYLMSGYQQLVRGEIMRGKYRNSFEKPEAFVPNKPTAVKFTLPDIAHTFKKGHRMMIQIQSSWFPLVDRNPQQFMNIYQAKDSDFKKATIRIYHDASVIQLPVLTN
jgi:predicted acyl esterase